MDGLTTAGGSMEDSVCGNRVWGTVTPLLATIIKSPVAKKA